MLSSLNLPLYSVLSLLLCFFQTTIFAQQKTVFSKIDSILLSKRDKPFNGVVYIVQNRVDVYTKTLGEADFEKQIPLAVDDQFVIGSISKQFTAVLTLQEVDKGNVNLFTPIRNYLPELDQAWADSVTVHHLLTHMHGITSLDLPTAFPVGTQYSYSQIGYDLLAKIIERTTGVSFAERSETLFQQCGMENTFHPDVKKYDKLVKGYTENSKGELERDSQTFKNYVAAGSFISTASDLIKWNTLFYNGKLLEKNTMSALLTKQKGAVRNHPIFGITEYGYGITIDTKDGIVQLGQTGYVPGFVSMNFYFPESKTSLVVWENVVYDEEDIKKTFYYHTQVRDALRDQLKPNQAL